MTDFSSSTQAIPEAGTIPRHRHPNAAGATLLPLDEAA